MDWKACEYRVADYTLECATCGDKFWESDLERVDVAWFEQSTAVLLCQACLAEAEEAEETCEDFNAGEEFRGQLEIALAVA